MNKFDLLFSNYFKKYFPQGACIFSPQSSCLSFLSIGNRNPSTDELWKTSMVVCVKCSWVRQCTDRKFPISLKKCNCLLQVVQCDQMARLIFQNFAICNYQNLPNSIKCAKRGSKFWQKFKQTLQKLAKADVNHC